MGGFPLPRDGESGPRAGASADRLEQRAEEMRALIPELPDLSDPARIGDAYVGLLEILERKQRQLIQNNVRLTGLRELTETLLQDPDEEKVLRTISLFLRHAYGLAEVVVLSGTEEGGLRGYRARAGAGGLCEAIRWSAETIRQTPWERVLAGLPGTGGEATPPPGTPAAPPILVPLQAGSEEAIETGNPILGLLGLRPDDSSGAGNDPLEVEQIAFQAATLLESVRNQQRNARERRFRECLLEAMGDGLLALDAGGRITALNRAAQALLACEREALLGQPIERLGDAAPLLVAACRRSLAEGNGVDHEEILIAAGRARFPASLSIVPLGAGGEDAGGIVVTLSDLRALRAMEQEMRRLDRLAALGRFASAVAHEIRNPLAAIGAGVDFLASHIPANQQEDLDLLRGEITRLDRIVRDLLEPARRQPLQKSTLGVAKLVQRSCQAVEPLARERGIRFSIRLPLEESLQPASVEVDPDRMVQVMVNLVRNATEASPAGAEVEIGWQTHRSASAPILRIWIEDRGPGIAPEHLPHIFEPFYSTKSGGTGLGLYVCHGLVEQHGGELRVEPVPAGGTRMVLDLPCLESQEDGCPLRS